MTIKFGYKASAEQFGPLDLLEFTTRAEEVGFDSVAVSDHFQPWRHSTGHAPNSLVWLGAAAHATQRVVLATSVLTPTMRYHPAIVAQAFGTLACLSPDRIVLGVGTGEAMNETPATAGRWPSGKERRRRLAESIDLIRQLLAEDRITFHGDYYRTDKATIYDRPTKPVPIYIAASGPLAATLAGSRGDGFICTSGKPRELYGELLRKVDEGAERAGRDPASLERVIEIKVSYDRDIDVARRNCEWWAALALKPEEKTGVDDPIEMERLADAALDRAHTRFIVTNDPHECQRQIGTYVDLGFDHLVVHGPGNDQHRFLTQFAADVLPLLRDRVGFDAKDVS